MTTVDLIEGGLPFIGGLAVTLYSFGVFSSPELDRWRDKHGRTMRILGPILMISGVARAFGAW